MSDYPIWLATENAVKHFFILLGFDVQNVSISGRQIDIVARRADILTLVPEVWVIEVTMEYVSAEKGAKDSQKLLLAKKEYKNAKLMIVSTAGFTDDQKATLDGLGIIPKRFFELESTVLPLRKYALAAQMDLRHQIAPDIGYDPSCYVEPELEIRHSDGETKDEIEVISSETWIETVLENPRPGIWALLGTLGSGKTSLMKRILERGISRFLEQPDLHPLPIYVPLGRYKQHAGDLDQMLMAELRRVGNIDTYPATLVRHHLEHRRIILLLDGLDEVHPIQNTNDVLDTVTNILSGIGQKATGILSCRKQFFESTAEELAYFGNFTAGKVKDLNLSLQKKLSGSPSTFIASVRPFDHIRIEQYLVRRCNMSPSEVANLFKRYYGFPDLASTPVFLAMIATTVQDGSLDAQGIADFPLVQLYQAYTNRWLERDVGRARLNFAQRQHFSEHLANRMLWEARESASWADVSRALRENSAWGDNPLTQEEAELDIRNSGFLIRELDDQWRFAHRSILEYFAAKVELNRLSEGERPRYIPTDGYRLFLTQLMASKWLSDGVSPIPFSSWLSSRGDEVRANQWSLLAAASTLLPENATVSLSIGSDLLTVSQDTNWKATHFKDLRLQITAGEVNFTRCIFLKCHIDIPDTADTLMHLKDCKYESTEIHFAVMPDWITDYDTDGDKAVGVPVAAWTFSIAVEWGARVFVGRTEWLLNASHLSLFLEAGNRLKGKIQKRNFVRGAHGDKLKALLPRLLQEQLVDEDRSRQPHQLEWTSSGRALVAMLKMDPVQGQRRLAALFDER